MSWTPDSGKSGQRWSASGKTMISKRIFISADNDDYARLAAYIADAKGRDTEKCLMHWCAGMEGGDDYLDGIDEVTDVQALNLRARHKTYHLVISFRPEDEAKLTPEAFRAIEERFAAALGYSEHQRHCGVHKNTANLHMHIAYNMIHPEKRTVHKAFRDFWIRDRACRELERELGLSPDQGRNALLPVRSNEKARCMEAHSGQQSFDSYARQHKDALVHSLQAAASWQDAHTALAVYGMEIRPHGNGLVIRDRHSPKLSHSIKASAVDRSFSFKKLESRFGAFQPAQDMSHVQEQARYTAAPLHRAPERGKLFSEYRAGIERRTARLQEVREQEDAALVAVRAQWAAKRQELERSGIAKKNLRRLMQIARRHEAEALAKTRLSFQEPRQAVRRDIPFTSWNGFLQHKAGQGNEIALAVLRSRGQLMEREQAPLVKDWLTHGLEQFSLQAGYTGRAREIMERENLSSRSNARLQAFIRMEKALPHTAFRQRIDHKGTIIFSLADGAHIRDNGRDIFFTASSENARQAALRYARQKWGRNLRFDGCHIIRQPEQVREQLGVER